MYFKRLSLLVQFFVLHTVGRKMVFPLIVVIVVMMTFRAMELSGSADERLPTDIASSLLGSKRALDV